MFTVPHIVFKENFKIIKFVVIYYYMTYSPQFKLWIIQAKTGPEDFKLTRFDCRELC